MSTFSYVPNTSDDQKKMLNFLGIDQVSQLFEDIPASVRMNRNLNLWPSMSEIELERHMNKLARKNQDLTTLVSFLGAGAYEHYVPSAVDAIVGRSEFYTSYTPYQPEVSQGMLQAIFEYQTVVSELTGMDLANASMYDGPTALGEAGLVCCSHTRRNKLLVASAMHPEYRSVLATYAKGQSVEVAELPHTDGVLNMNQLDELCDASVAGVLIQYPNFFGCIEDVRAIADLVHSRGALLVVNTYPIALGLLQSPGELGADIVIAEGQSLGNAISYGGPYLGIMAARKELMRRMPGRIVGQTVDHDERRGFVLTLQAREQHIRREKASSNICSNQALNALAATVYLAYLGKQGIADVALQNFHKAHYLKNQLTAIAGVEAAFQKPFFNEFVVRLPKAASTVQEALINEGFVFGLDLGRFYDNMSDTVLLNVTEMRTKAEIDLVCEKLEGIL